MGTVRTSPPDPTTLLLRTLWLTLAGTVLVLALTFGITIGLVVIIAAAWCGGVVTNRLAGGARD